MFELDYFNIELSDNESIEEVENIVMAHLSMSGKMISLSLNSEESIFWIVVRVNTEDEIIELINSIPLDFELSYEFFRLDHYEVIQEIGSFSLN